MVVRARNGTRSRRYATADRQVVIWRFTEHLWMAEHPKPGGGRCVGTLDTRQHTIVSRNPLTITPSLDCPACGWHHFVTDGQVR